MRRIWTLCLILALASCAPKKEVKETSKYSKRVRELLSKMTLDEKIGQLNNYSVGADMTGPGQKNAKSQERYEKLMNGGVGSVLNLLGAHDTYKMQKQVVENTRLGIPLIFGYDVIHGYRTIFPIPLGMTASWDTAAFREASHVAAVESAASGINWTFAPMLDVSRDARWGRVMEGSGEDPYLVTQMGLASIRGFQGNDLSDAQTIAACAKHFAAYGFVIGGRDYNNTVIGKNTLMNVVMPPFKAAAKHGVATFMSAFNDIEGMPASGNEFLIRDMLKGKWQYPGAVTSDWNSIGEMVNHGVAQDKKQAAAIAMKAGEDIDMEGDAYTEHLKKLITSGKVSEKLLDDAVLRVLQLKENLGLLDDPYKYCDTVAEAQNVYTAATKAAAREVARKSIVLLKNEKQLLPLTKGKRIAVIGPLAKDKDTPLGNWRANGQKGSAVSFYEGLQNAVGDNTTIDYAAGCKLSIGPNNFFEELKIEQKDSSGFPEAVAKAKRADVVFMVLGEPAYMSGEARSRANLGLPGLQEQLLRVVYKANPNVVLVLMNGRPLTLPWEAAHIPAIVETWHLGTEAGNAIADVLTGKYNPSGKLPMSFPREVGQEPLYYNHKNTGRPETAPGQVFYSHYMDVKNGALYPFGYGLSYTHFTYGKMKLSADKLSGGESINVSIKITNDGDWDGAEVVQLYLRDMVASVTRPIKELKHFQKIFLKKGESKTITFHITVEDLKFYNAQLDYVAEPGAFTVMVGPNSQEVQKATFTYLKN